MVDELQVWMEREKNKSAGIADELYEFLFIAQLVEETFLAERVEAREKLYSAEGYLSKQWHMAIPSKESVINYEARKILIKLMSDV
jgi:hypothetical protein